MSPTTITTTIDDTPLNLRNPHRPIHAGIILLGGTTELLDISPIDIFSGMSSEFIGSLGEDIMSPGMKAQALDVKIHYVNENGGTAKLTSGMVIEVTVSFLSSFSVFIVLCCNVRFVSFCPFVGRMVRLYN
jgi:hypothetical protein